jgi:hypothetical protein
MGKAGKDIFHKSFVSFHFSFSFFIGCPIKRRVAEAQRRKENIQTFRVDS